METACAIGMTLVVRRVFHRSKFIAPAFPVSEMLALSVAIRRPDGRTLTVAIARSPHGEARKCKHKILRHKVDDCSRKKPLKYEGMAQMNLHVIVVCSIVLVVQYRSKRYVGKN